MPTYGKMFTFYASCLYASELFCQINANYVDEIALKGLFVCFKGTRGYYSFETFAIQRQDRSRMQVSSRQQRVGMAALGVCMVGATWAWWPGAITKVGSENYLPHAYCYLWNKQLLTLHIVSDVLIFLSYLAISCTLAWLVRKERRHIPFAWIFVAFGFFIVACGFTHAMDVIVLWKPFYWLAGDIKLITAVASLTTAVALPFLVPKAGSLLQEASCSIANERRFLAASESSNDAFYILESVRNAQGEIFDFRFAFSNETGARLISSTPQFLQGKLLFQILPLWWANGLFEHYKRVVDTGERFEQEAPISDQAVKASWLYRKVVKLEDGVAITSTDITVRKNNERKLISLATFQESVFASSPFATIVTDGSGTITSINPAAERMLRYRREDLIDQATPLVLLDSHELARRATALSEELRVSIPPGMAVLTAKPERGMVEEAEWKLIRQDGSRLDAQLTVSALMTSEGESAGLVLIAYDITERKRTEEYIAFLAHHDGLTGLPTRTLLYDRMDGALARADRNRRKVALLVLDLDGFKKINDSMGHAAGDKLLVGIAERLQSSVRVTDTVARMGGDEFVIVLDGLHAQEEAATLTEKILLWLQSSITIQGHTFSPSASVGICLYPDQADSMEDLLKNADEAMYQAKAAGRNEYRIFTGSMASAKYRKTHLEEGLREALNRNELELLYQPQISLQTGTVTGVEALLRWRSSELGIVMPEEFIPIAEDSGLIVSIGEWIVRTACHAGKQLQLATGKQLTVAVNVSPRQLQRTNLSAWIGRILAESGLDAASLELEITENILLSDSPESVAILEEVRSLGVRLAIDDFGVGFSSMSYLMRFRVHRIKIDRSFIQNVTVNPDSSAIATAVIALAGGLSIPVVAEGVETAAQRDFLQARGCNDGQGYLWSKPMPIESLPDIIHSLEQPSMRSTRN